MKECLLSLIKWSNFKQGAVYAVDETTIFIKGFDYDGMAPDAYFWVGVSKQPSPEGFIVPFPEDYDGP